MRTRRRIVLLIAGLTTLLLFLCLKEREPSYEGRSLSEWISDLPSPTAPPPPPEVNPGERADTIKRANAAIAKMGTRAAPHLVRWIAYKPSRWKTALYGAINSVLRRLPTDRQLEDGAWIRAERAAVALLNLRQPGHDTLRDLAQLMDDSDSRVADRATSALRAFQDRVLEANLILLTNRSAEVRWFAIGGLWKKSLFIDLRPFVPAVIARLQDEDTKVAAEAACQLGALQLGAETVVPALIRALEDNRPDVRLEAGFALGKFGPLAASALGALSRALNDPSERVRMVAANAIKDITLSSPR
jgi:hypothetical protein